MTYAPNPDFAEQAVDDTKQQLRRAVSFGALVQIFTRQSQEIDDMYWDSLIRFYLDDAVGDQLDILGRIVDQPRLGFSDEDYRPVIRAKIRANKSNASAPAIIGVASALFEDTGTQIYTPYYPASFTLEVVDPILSAMVGDALVRLIGIAKAAGVGALVLYSSARAVADLSSANESTLTDGAQGPGGLSLIVDDNGLFPASGRLVVSPGVFGAQEVVEYSGKASATEFTLRTELQNAHADNAEVFFFVCWEDGATSTDPLDVFKFPTATFLNGPTPALSNTVIVDDTSEFPFSGQLILSEGLPEQETVAYQAKTASAFVLTGTTANAHIDDAAVRLDDGDGFADVVTFNNTDDFVLDNFLSTDPSPDAAGFVVGDYAIIPGNDPQNACYYEVTNVNAGLLGIKPPLVSDLPLGSSIVKADGTGGQWSTVKEA